MRYVVAISASPSKRSKTTALAQYILDELDSDKITTDNIVLNRIDGNALLRGDIANEMLFSAVNQVSRADGIVIATPIFKAAYSGLLKAFLDVLPQFAFAGKTVLPAATGGTLSHVLALDYALRPVVQSMGARHVVQAYFLTEEAIESIEGGLQLKNGGPDDLLREAIFHFRYALNIRRPIPSLGHPRPQRIIT